MEIWAIKELELRVMKNSKRSFRIIFIIKNGRAKSPPIKLIKI
jgi:hypothetical protein